MRDGWQQTSLGLVCKFQGGDAFGKDQQGQTSGDHPFIKVSDMNLAGNEIYMSRANNWVSSGLGGKKYRLHPEGSVVFAKIGIALTYNRRRIITRPTAIDNNMMSAVAISNNNPKWLYYLLSTLDFNLISSGSALPYLTVGDLNKIRVELPPRSEQDAIASVLGSIDEKIDLNRRLNETLEAIGRAIFNDWFVDFGPTRAQMAARAPYLAPELWNLFPERLDGEGRPQGWTVTVLADVISELETGLRPKGGVASYQTGIPSIGAESIVGLGRFDFTKTKFVPEEFFNSMKRGHVQNRDILLYKDGGRPGEFEPHVTMFGDGFPFSNCCINEHVYRVRADKELGQAWLYFWLTSDLLMEEMRIKGTGVAIPGLNSTQVRTLTTLVPNKALIGYFNEAAEPLLARILANCVETRNLAATRNLLLPKLMSGEIRVRDAEKIAEAAA